MPPDQARGPSGERDLEAELDAERAATAHWRRVARQRSDDFASLRHRPLVRAVLAAERRVAPLARPIRRVTARAQGLRERAALLALSATAPGRRRAAGRLRHRLGDLPVPPADARRTLLVVVGSDAPASVSGVSDAGNVDLVAVGPSPVAVRRALEGSGHDVVGIILATTEPLDAGWLRRLVTELRGDVVAATPLLVHPRRPLRRATPQDGRVRAAGLAVTATADGAPEVRSRAAGDVPEPTQPVQEVDAASAACVVVARQAYEGAGGLPGVDDLDVAVVELSARLRTDGGRVVVVPGCVVLDHRPVRSRRALVGPIDPAGRPWRDAVDRVGPALVSSTSGSAPPLRFALTVAAPSAKVAARWGDWHLAEGLAGGLRRLGHQVLVQTAADADHPAGRACDVHVVVRGLQAVRRTPGQHHVLWVISHPEAIEDVELDAADLVLVASPRFADHLRSRTATPVEVLLQATDHHRFRPHPVDPAHRHDVTVVAKTRDVLRPIVADALSVGIRPAIYGGGWGHLVDPALIAAEHVDNELLPIVYSSAGVVLNDHWRTMQAWGFVSNRLFDVLACGTPVISDPVAGTAELFDGAVLDYHSPSELRDLVDAVLADPEGARLRADRGRVAVLAAHTFDHRARELLDAIARCSAMAQISRRASAGLT